MGASERPRKWDRNLGPENRAMLVWAVPMKLKTAFKIKCTRKGLSLREAIIKLMTSFVNRA